MRTITITAFLFACGCTTFDEIPASFDLYPPIIVNCSSWSQPVTLTRIGYSTVVDGLEVSSKCNFSFY